MTTETQSDTNNNTDDELWHSCECLSADDAVGKGYHIIFSNMQLSVEHANRALEQYNRTYMPIEDEPVFIKDDNLVYLTKDAHGIYILKPVTKGKLSIILNRGTMWYKDAGKKNGEDNLSPAVRLPADFIDAVLSAGSRTLDRVPVVRNIHSGALLDKNWNVVNRRGYNKSTKLYLTKDMPVEDVPAVVTEELVAEQRAMLWDIFREFNFSDMNKGEDSVDYQNTVAALATAILRPTWDGALPIWVVSKSSERTGGSLLQEIVGILACGDEQPKYIFPKKEEEYEKGIHSFIIDGTRFGMIDNVLEGSSWVTPGLLVQSTGSGRTKIRVYGAQTLREFYPETFFAVNGINIELRADIVGRIILTNIVPDKSWQELKYGRTEQELRDLAKMRHPDVVRALAIFYRYWVQQGCPKHVELKGNFDAYSKWEDTVLAVLNCAGYTNVIANLEKVQGECNVADEENDSMIKALSDKWPLNTPFSAAEVAKELVLQGDSRRRYGEGDDLLKTFPEKIIKKAMDRTLSSQSAGMVLHHLANRKVKGTPIYLEQLGRQYLIRKVAVQTSGQPNHQ